jgi:signal transduction histidine kinase
MHPIPPGDITRMILLVSPSRLDGDKFRPPKETITFASLSRIVQHRVAGKSYHCWLIYTKGSEKTVEFLRDAFSAYFQVFEPLPIERLDSALEIFEAILNVASHPVSANHQVYCDCTGGHKTMSIAMAFACTHHQFLTDAKTELILTYIPPDSDDFHRYDLSRIVAEEQDRYIEQQKRMGQMEYLARFSPILAHEIKNPLNLIMADLYLLRFESEDEYVKELLGEIKSSVNEIDRIINRVQQVVRGETDYAAPLIALTVVIQRLKARCERRFPDLTIRVRGKTAGIQLRIAEEKLYSIFTNLIDNTAKATQGKGTITLAFDPYKDLLLVDVKDNGPGIPQALRSDIFKPMQREKNASGTGMGLSIVKAFVLSEGGKITYDSDYEDGTRFLIELPIQKNSEVHS